MAGLLDDWMNQQPTAGGLLNVDDMKRAQQMGLFGGLGRVAEALMMQGQPSRTPGGGIGSAFAAFPGGYAQAQGAAADSAVKQKVMGQQFDMNKVNLQQAQYNLKREQDWYGGGQTQMVGTPQPNGEIVGPAGPAMGGDVPGATPASMGVPRNEVDLLNSLPPAQREAIRALGPVAGPKALADLALKQMETNEWENAEQGGIKGQRNKRTGKFEAFPASALTDQYTQEVVNGVGMQRNTRTNKLEPLDSTPKTNVRVSVKGPVAGAESAWKGVAEQWTTMRDTVARANKREANFQNFETAMQSFDPGIDANVRMKAAQAFNAIGMKTNAPQAELMLKIQRENELANTPRGQGQITENERGLIRDANNLLGSTPQGARLVMAATRQADAYDRKVFEIMTDSAKNNGGAPNPVEVSQALAQLGPVLDPALESQLRAMAGPKEGNAGASGEWSATVKKKPQ